MEQESNRSTELEPTSTAVDYDNEEEGEELKYSSVAIKPVKNTKMSALDRIKAIQEADWKTWKGPNCKHSGRPGTAGLIKSRTKKDPNIQETKDEMRFKSLLSLMQKLDDLDDE